MFLCTIMTPFLTMELPVLQRSEHMPPAQLVLQTPGDSLYDQSSQQALHGDIVLRCTIS